MTVTALDKIKEAFITEEELAKFLGVAIERIRDMRSYHKTGKAAFIPYISPTSRCHLYHIDSVMQWLMKCPTVRFEKVPD